MAGEAGRGAQGTVGRGGGGGLDPVPVDEPVLVPDEAPGRGFIDGAEDEFDHIGSDEGGPFRSSAEVEMFVQRRGVHEVTAPTDGAVEAIGDQLEADDMVADRLVGKDGIMHR